jgi:hypothetical protein
MNMKSFVFWDMTPSSSPVKDNLATACNTCYLCHDGFLLISFFDSVKMKAICCSDTSVDFQWTTWRCDLGDTRRTLYSDR